MKTAVYFCKCGTNIAGKVNPDEVRRGLNVEGSEIHFVPVDFLCSDDGKEQMVADIREIRPDRVVVAACSPRDHELTFMQALEQSAMNPYLLQMVNIREQVAWVTENAAEATAKAIRQIRAAIRRVALHEPLAVEHIDMCPDVLIVGAGPAGIKAALSLAEAGRHVTLIEQTAAIGGAAVKYEEVFPHMECAPCMLEPPMGELLHGPHADRIELLPLSDLESVVGFYGNYAATIRQRPRGVDTHRCIGCAECIAPCPVSIKNEVNYSRDQRKAIAFPYAGALPNAPFIDGQACVRSKGEACTLCRDACPVDDTILFDQKEQQHTRNVGAIVLATGADEYDVRKIPHLRYGASPDIYTGLEFERILASNGPTNGELVTAAGIPPGTVAIVHCVGSLDAHHKQYCSGICCQYAFKFNHLIQKKAPGTRVHHVYKEIVVPGKDDSDLYMHARHASTSTFLRYDDINQIRVDDHNGKPHLIVAPAGAPEIRIEADMVVLCPAVVPRASQAALAGVLEVGTDAMGFFGELHDRMDSGRSKVKGVYLAGTCQAPMNIQQAVNQSVAATGYILSGLVEGRKLDVSPVTAHVNQDRCSGCKVCADVCPYHAIRLLEDRNVSEVNAVLCQGCGTCVAACPAGAMEGSHFTNAMIMAEIDEVLQ
jgi:heterodisulfide reductase subunit A2